MWQLIFAVCVGTLVEHAIEAVIAFCRTRLKQRTKVVQLEPIKFADLDSPDLSVRRKANQIVACNESKLYGQVTRATAAVLRNLDAEQARELNAGNADSLPARS